MNIYGIDPEPMLVQRLREAARAYLLAYGERAQVAFVCAGDADALKQWYRENLPNEPAEEAVQLFGMDIAAMPCEYTGGVIVGRYLRG